MTTPYIHNCNNVEDFAAVLKEHVFSFTKAIQGSEITEEGLQILVADVEAEIRIYETAWNYGDEYMKTLSGFMYLAKQKLASVKTSQEDTDRVLLEILDEDLKLYNLKLKNHDWFWSFSDDASVARNGNSCETELKKEATVKGGYFLKLWYHYEAKRSTTIAKS